MVPAVEKFARFIAFSFNASLVAFVYSLVQYDESSILNVIEPYNLGLPQKMIMIDLSIGMNVICSIDQFFECFDELRSSQVYPASGHIWNWTCSVFNAISVASNLASGMGDIPKGNFHCPFARLVAVALVVIP